MSDLIHPEGLAVKQGLHGRPAAAHLALVRPLRVVFVQPGVQIGLQLFQRVIQLAPERNLVKLVQYGLVEPFADAVRLRMPRLALGVFNAVDRAAGFGNIAQLGGQVEQSGLVSDDALVETFHWAWCPAWAAGRAKKGRGTASFCQGTMKAVVAVAPEKRRMLTSARAMASRMAVSPEKP